MGVLKGRLFFLLRRPSTQEDEGLFGFIGSYGTLAAADAARTEMVQKSKGYFTDGSFVIAQEIRIPAGVSSPPRLEHGNNEGTKGSNHG